MGFWQRTCKAVPHGYIGEIDVNIFNGDYNEFKKNRNNVHK